MATNNAVNTSLSGQTGTGAFAGSTSPILTSPTLVTPTLGVASATSINFGGSALANYNEYQTFTPTFTFATPGDLSVSYSVQTGYYTRIGNMVYISYTLRFTPTYTTSAGSAYFSSLPFTANASGNFRLVVAISEATTWPASTTMLYAGIATSTTFFTITGIGSGAAAAPLTITNFPTATQKTVVVSGFYAI